MRRKPKMPKYVGLIVCRDEDLAGAQPGYSISLTVGARDLGVSGDSTNDEMVQAFIDVIRKRARAEERARVVAYLREHPIAIDQPAWRIDAGPKATVRRFVLQACEEIEEGEHVHPAGGA